MELRRCHLRAQRGVVRQPRSRRDRDPQLSLAARARRRRGRVRRAGADGLPRARPSRVPAITLEGDANGAPHPDPSAYAARFSGPYSHRTIGGGVGHNLPQEAPDAFADAVLEVGGALSELVRQRQSSRGVARRRPAPGVRRRGRLAELAAADGSRPARTGRGGRTSGRTPASTGCARSATSARGPRSTRSRGWWWSASTRPSSRSSVKSTTSAGPAATCASRIPSRSIPTTRVAGVQRTTTGRPCTSPTPRGGSGITTSARALTTNVRRAIQRPPARGRVPRRRATSSSRSSARRHRSAGRLGEPGVAGDLSRGRAGPPRAAPRRRDPRPAVR